MEKKEGLLKNHFKDNEYSNLLTFLNYILDEFEEKYTTPAEQMFINKFDYYYLKENIDKLGWALDTSCGRDYLLKGEMMHLWTTDLYPCSNKEIKIIAQPSLDRDTCEIIFDENYISNWFKEKQK